MGVGFQLVLCISGNNSGTSLTEFRSRCRPCGGLSIHCFRMFSASAGSVLDLMTNCSLNSLMDNTGGWPHSKLLSRPGCGKVDCLFEGSLQISQTQVNEFGLLSRYSVEGML